MIEAVNEQSLEAILPLIRNYQRFYGVENATDEANWRFFCQFGIDNPAGCQFLFRESKEILGFATVYFTFTSTLAAKVAVLNDLYTLPEARGQGIGRQLLEHCRAYAAQQGAIRLQWVTAPDNAPAQRLYNSLKTDKRTWLSYTYPV